MNRTRHPFLRLHMAARAEREYGTGGLPRGKARRSGREILRMSDRIRFELSVPVATRQDSVGYIACCPALDVYSQGPTEDVAVRNLVEALELFLASCYRRGQLDRVLKDCGFELDQNPESPAPDPH